MAYQGHEITRDGTLTLPLTDHHRERVLAVKRGEVSMDEVSAEIGEYEERVRGLLDTASTPLPEVADLATISEWSVRAHRRHWRWP